MIECRYGHIVLNLSFLITPNTILDIKREHSKEKLSGVRNSLTVNIGTEGLQLLNTERRKVYFTGKQIELPFRNPNLLYFNLPILQLGIIAEIAMEIKTLDSKHCK